MSELLQSQNEGGVGKKTILSYDSLKAEQYRTSFCSGNPSVPGTPYMCFLFVIPFSLRPRPRFSPDSASSQAQICLPYRLRPTVPAAKSAADFQCLVIAQDQRKKRLFYAKQETFMFLRSPNRFFRHDRGQFRLILPSFFQRMKSTDPVMTFPAK